MQPFYADINRKVFNLLQIYHINMFCLSIEIHAMAASNVSVLHCLNVALIQFYSQHLQCMKGLMVSGAD